MGSIDDAESSAEDVFRDSRRARASQAPLKAARRLCGICSPGLWQPLAGGCSPLEQASFSRNETTGRRSGLHLRRRPQLAPAALRPAGSKFKGRAKPVAEPRPPFTLAPIAAVASLPSWRRRARSRQMDWRRRASCGARLALQKWRPRFAEETCVILGRGASSTGKVCREFRVSPGGIIALSLHQKSPPLSGVNSFRAKADRDSARAADADDDNGPTD